MTGERKPTSMGSGIAKVLGSFLRSVEVTPVAPDFSEASTTLDPSRIAVITRQVRLERNRATIDAQARAITAAVYETETLKPENMMTASSEPEFRHGWIGYKKAVETNLPNTSANIIDIPSIPLPSRDDGKSGNPYLDEFVMYRLGFVDASDGTKTPQLFVRECSEVSDGVFASNRMPLQVFYMPLEVAREGFEVVQTLADAMTAARESAQPSS